MVVPDPSIVPLPSPVPLPVVAVSVVELDGSPEFELDDAPPALLEVTGPLVLVVLPTLVADVLEPVVLDAPDVLVSVIVFTVALLVFVLLAAFAVADVIVDVPLVLAVVLVTVPVTSGSSSVVLEHAASSAPTIMAEEAQLISKVRRMIAPKGRIHRHGSTVGAQLQTEATIPISANSATSPCRDRQRAAHVGLQLQSKSIVY